MSVAKTPQTRTGPAPAATAPGAAPAAKVAAPAAPPAAPAVDGEKLRAMTERIAYEMYEQRGCAHGRDLDDWLEAEKAARARLLAGGS